jgi:hypothetical protein
MAQEKRPDYTPFEGTVPGINPPKTQGRCGEALQEAGERARVHYLREYYFEDQWSYDYLKTLGITQLDRTPPPGEPQDRPRRFAERHP